MNGACEASGSAWMERVIYGDRLGLDDVPGWLREWFPAFHSTVTHDAYPCFFGAQAERAGDVYLSYVEGDDLAHLPRTLRTFQSSNATRRGRGNLAVFFEPQDQALDHQRYAARFWSTLQFLHDHDWQPPHSPVSVDPSHYLWEFPFGGELFFVIGISPSHRRRRSRNLGPGMMMLFQPRSVFADPATGRPLGEAARRLVRQRLERWDGVTAHPALGSYGDPANLEWRQYFLPDGAEPVVPKKCPLVMHATPAAAHASSPARVPPMTVTVKRSSNR